MFEKDLSIIIINYNVKDLLVSCIKSVFLNCPEGVKLEIIVVDNDSSDGSVECLRHNFDQIILVENKFNAGFAEANNQGLRIAKGEIILLLNPDTEILSDAIGTLYTYLKITPKCAIVAPQLILANGEIQPSIWNDHKYLDMIYDTFMINKFVNRLNIDPGNSKGALEVKTMSGAALMFRKNLVDKIGFLDPELFWMEDIDFCYRAQKQGSIIYLPTAKIKHYGGQSQMKNYKVAISNQLISKLKYYRKHSTLIQQVIASFFCFIFIISRILAFSLLFLFNKKFRTKTKIYFYTLNRYLRFVFLNDKRIV